MSLINYILLWNTYEVKYDRLRTNVNIMKIWKDTADELAAQLDALDLDRGRRHLMELLTPPPASFKSFLMRNEHSAQINWLPDLNFAMQHFLLISLSMESQAWLDVFFITSHLSCHKFVSVHARGHLENLEVLQYRGQPIIQAENHEKNSSTSS